MRRLALPLLALALGSGSARAETVFTGPVSDARLAIQVNGEPIAAVVANGVLSIVVRSAGVWSGASVDLPANDVELDGLALGQAGTYVLLRERSGAWLALAGLGPLGTWGWRTIFPDSNRDAIGPAGLAVDRQNQPVIAYALWTPSRKTYLRLVRGRVTTRITRKGFPPSSTLPAAAPVLLPSGAIRVVETYLPAAIEWRPIPHDWEGQFLRSSALGVPVGTISTAVADSVVYAAWTEAYPTLGPPAVVLASHGTRTASAVAVEDAVLAGLAVTPQGPEVAANRCIPAVAFGLEGDDVCGGLIGATGLDGIVAGFAVAPDGAHELLLDSANGLDWFHSPGPLGLRVTLNQDLTGRVDGASGGAVQLYRERPGQRMLVGSFPVAADGSFAAGDPTATPVVAAYRAVYADAATGIPYAALVGPSVS